MGESVNPRDRFLASIQNEKLFEVADIVYLDALNAIPLADDWFAYYCYFAKRLGASDDEFSWVINYILGLVFLAAFNPEDYTDNPYQIPSKGSDDGIDEFNGNVFNLLRRAFDLSNDRFFRARIADILWSYRDRWTENNKAAIPYAQYAFTAFSTYPFVSENWALVGLKVWKRAVKLASVAQSKDCDAIQIIRAKLKDGILSDDMRLRKCVPQLVSLLIKTRIKNCSGFEQIEHHLLSLLDCAIAEDDEMRVLALKRAISEWSMVIKSDVGAINCRVGDYFFDKASFLHMSEEFNPGVSAGRVMGWYSSARSAYENCTQEGVAKEKISEIRKRQQEVRGRFLSHLSEERAYMGVIPDERMELNEELDSLPEKDISSWLEGVFPTIPYDKFQQSAEAHFAAHSLENCFEKVFVQDGRRVAVQTAVTQNMSDEAKSEWRTNEEIHEYRLFIEYQTIARLIPACQLMRSRVECRYAELVELCRKSSFVPTDHCESFARGLAYGLNGDYWTAVSLLTPQLEAAIRKRLRDVGSLTSVEKRGELDNEIVLSSLLERPEINLVFPDAHQLFELRALFGSKWGYAYNLRNNLQHGLIKDDDITAPVMTYCWWFIFRLVILSIDDGKKECA